LSAISRYAMPPYPEARWFVDSWLSFGWNPRVT